MQGVGRKGEGEHPLVPGLRVGVRVRGRRRVRVSVRFRFRVRVRVALGLVLGEASMPIRVRCGTTWGSGSSCESLPDQVFSVAW